MSERSAGRKGKAAGASGALTEDALVRIVSDFGDAGPGGAHRKFHLFLGAGASAKSGVRLAGTMMREFEQRLEAEMPSIREEAWYQQGDFVFARLFDRAYDNALHRQNYIQKCLEAAEPSEGYYFLASLINSHAAFRVVMTTNFDDLVSTACINLNCGRRPLELWNASLFHKLDSYAGYPIVVKLHGDYRDPDIANTVDEVEQTFGNFNHALKGLAKNSGLVVVGYSGADQVLIDMLRDGLLRRKTEPFFPLNIYWCLYNDETPIPPVAELAAKFPEHFRFVRTGGFDGLMEKIYHACTGANSGVAIPPALSRRFVDWLGKRTLEELAEASSPSAVQYGLAYLSVSSPADLSRVARAAQRMADLGLRDASARFLQVVMQCRSHFVGDPMITFDIALAFLWLGCFAEAHQILEMGLGCSKENSHALWNEDRYFINACLVQRCRGEALSPEDSTRLRQIAAGDKAPERMGAGILLDDAANVTPLIDRLIEQGTLKTDRTTLRKWYILKFFYDRRRDHISPGHLAAFDEAYGPAPAATA